MNPLQIYKPIKQICFWIKGICTSAYFLQKSLAENFVKVA